jgi:thiol peroxidase
MANNNSAITLKGNKVDIRGTTPTLGSPAPSFTLIGNNFNEVKLEDYQGKVLILSVLPSLETPVCHLETKRFNEEATKLGGEVAIVTASLDLPFAQKRWCGQEGVENLVTASDFKFHSLEKNYGVLVEQMGLLTRAVFVIDKNQNLAYVQYVSEIAEEPNYQEIIDQVKKLL